MNTVLLTVFVSVIAVTLAIRGAHEKETICSEDVEYLSACLIEAYQTHKDLEEIPAWAEFNNKCLNGPEQSATTCSKISKDLSTNGHERTANDVISRSARQGLLQCMRKMDGANPRREAAKCAAPDNSNRVTFQRAKQEYERHRGATYGFVRALNKVDDIIVECDHLSVAQCVFKLTKVNVVKLHLDGTIPTVYNPLACKCFSQVPRGECKKAVIEQKNEECKCTEQIWKKHRATAIKCGKKEGLSESEVDKYIKATVTDACYDDDTLPLCKNM